MKDNDEAVGDDSNLLSVWQELNREEVVAWLRGELTMDAVEIFRDPRILAVYRQGKALRPNIGQLAAQNSLQQDTRML